MPLVAYIDSPKPEDQPERRPWDPDWRVWRPALGALAAAGAAAQTEGGVEFALVVVAFGLACRALDAALPYRQGLREHRQ